MVIFILYSLLSFLCGCHNLLTQTVSYTMISNTKCHCILSSLSWMLKSVHTGSKLYYNIKYHLLMYSLLSFLCGCHNLFTQPVSYTIISNTKCHCILSSLSWMLKSVNTGCKLYYNIKYYMSLYSLISFMDVKIS